MSVVRMFLQFYLHVSAMKRHYSAVVPGTKTFQMACSLQGCNSCVNSINGKVEKLASKRINYFLCFCFSFIKTFPYISLL